MLRFTLILLFVLTVFTSDLISQTTEYNVPSKRKIVDKEEVVFIPDFECLFSFSYGSSSAFFDKDKKMVTELYDTQTFPGDTLLYTFNLIRYTFDLNFKYFIKPELDVHINAPLTVYNLTETFREKINYIDSIIYQKGTRAEFTRTRFDYIGLGTSYELSGGSFINRYFLDLHIPTGTQNGVANDPNEFWSDGAFELIPGFVVGTSNNKIKLEIGAKYDYRAEDMTDRLIGNVNFDLHSVPGTMLFIGLEGAYNVEKGNENIAFDIRKMPWQDEYLDANVGFRFLIDQQYLTDFSYRVRIDGRNEWNLATYYFMLGIRF